MLKQKVQDIRLRGRYFTLFPAASENGVPGDLMDYLLLATYSKAGLMSESYEKNFAVEKANPNIPDIISTEDLKKGSPTSKYTVNNLISAGLVTKETGNTLALTEKSINIIKRAAEIQKELDGEKFSYCPCNKHC